MAKVSKVTELQLEVRDKVGALAAVLTSLSDAGVNMMAYQACTCARKGTIALVAKNPAKAKRVLKAAGYKVKANPAIMVIERDRVGSGAGLAQKIADAGVNIKSTYASATGSGSYATIYRTSNDRKAMAALRR